jgi:hypothetical protein
MRRIDNRGIDRESHRNSLGLNVEELTFGKLGKCGTTTVTTVQDGTLDIEIVDLPAWTHNGTLTFTGTMIRVVTAIGGECFYTLGHAGTLTGGAKATIDLTGTLTRVGGNLFCPMQNASIIGFYKVTTPEPLWIST